MIRKNYDGRTIFMNSTLVSKIQKNKLEEIRISVLRNNKVDVRIYFYFPQETEAQPTRKGLWLSFKNIPGIVSTLEKIVKKPDELLNVEIGSTEKEQLRVYVNEYLGNKVVHIRSFYFKDKEYKPGKGISFTMPLVPQIAEGLRQSEKYREKD